MSLILLFDVGNTNSKLTLANEDELLFSFVMPTNANTTSDELGLKIVQVCNYFQVQPANINAWVVSSVVPHVNSLLTKACSKFFSCPIYFVPENLTLPIKNHYANPAEVGADRLVTAFGARRLFEARTLIVIDFGTATTVDCIRDDAYQGGLICPGVLSSIQALGTKTAKLPHISLEAGSCELEFGQNTAQSLNQGLLHGFASMIEGLASKMKLKVGDDQAKVIATGGFSFKISTVCTAIDHVQQDLLMQGLKIIYFENK